MIKRMLVVMVASMASPVLAQAISGTLSANFVSFNEFGGATTHVALNLACSLSCPAAAPELTFSAGFVDGFFTAEPMQTCGSLSTGFSADVRTTGTSSTDTTNFPAGSNFFVKARSMTCQCGSRFGEGGYIDLQSGTVSIPPWITLPLPPVKPGEFYLLMVSAAPRLGETVDVTVRGAGADYSASFPATDFVSTNSVPNAVPKFINNVPLTQPGTVTVTATVTGGPTATKTFEVVAGSASGGGGGSTGGGSGSTGGGGGDSAPAGCTAVPMLLPFALVLLLRRRRS